MATKTDKQSIMPSPMAAISGIPEWISDLSAYCRYEPADDTMRFWNVDSGCWELLVAANLGQPAEPAEPAAPAKAKFTYVVGQEPAEDPHAEPMP